MQTNLYLAYGSNLNLEQMRYRCPDAKVVGYTYLTVSWCSVVPRLAAT